MTDFVIPPAEPVSLAIAGSTQRFPVRRVYCIGRNYADHAREMGHDPDREPPFFFQKNPDSLDQSGMFPYPSASSDVHHEVELLVALGRGGTDIPAQDALTCVWGHAVALDMTRRDLQAQAKAQGRPWEVGKSFERSAPVGLLGRADGSTARSLAAAQIGLTVNGVVRQHSDLGRMIWSIAEIIAVLSRYFTLAAGDVILTGTPAGVAAVHRGDVLEAAIAGLPGLRVAVV